jgi:hypothetical protein
MLVQQDQLAFVVQLVNLGGELLTQAVPLALVPVNSDAHHR